MDKIIILGLFAKQEKVLASSRVIAERFNKRHDNIINKIDITINNWQNETDLKNKVSEYFILSSHKDSSGKLNKEYLLTRDGFSYIVMSFTGRESDF